MALPFYNWSRTAASNATADSTVNWAEGQAPSSVNDSGRAMMASTAAFRDDTSGGLITGGSSTAYTLTTYQVFDTLGHLNGQEIAFTVHTTSGASPTLNVDGLGAKPLRFATGVALAAGALVNTSVYRVTYNNSNSEFMISGYQALLASDAVTTTNITDANVTLAKLANLAQNTFIGRYTASTGVPQALTLSTGLAVNASTGAVTTTTNPSLFPGFLSGLELSTAGSSATFGIAVGGANDTTNVTLMALTSAYTKTTSAWAVGSGNGALDTSTIANNTWYHVYLIARSDTGVVDVLVSTSASSPTMPTNYDRKRRIGSMRTNGSAQWTKFTQVGDTFIWDTSTADLVASASVGSRTLTGLTVPTGILVYALFRAQLATGGIGASATLLTAPQESDQAPTALFADMSITVSSVQAASFERMTNTSAQIGYRVQNVNGTVSIYTYGWKDNRGK